MEVILLERIDKLGQLGEVVSVKPGYARNYLLPQKKALRATEANITHFESQRVQIEADNQKRREDGEAVAARLDGQIFVVIRQAGEGGHLYGSVSAGDIAQVVTENGFTVARSSVALDRPIKELGLHPARIVLHPEVSVTVTLNVAQSEEAAESQLRQPETEAAEGAETEAAQAPAEAPETNAAEDGESAAPADEAAAGDDDGAPTAEDTKEDSG